MSGERKKYIHDYFPEFEPANDGLNAFDIATRQGNVPLNRSLLPPRESGQLIDVRELDGDITWARRRSSGNPDADFHYTELKVKGKQLSQEIIVPSTIQAQNTAVIVTSGRTRLAGITESNYIYWRDSPITTDRLQQNVKVALAPSHLRPTVRVASVNRYVFGNRHFAHGHVIFEHSYPDITDRLEVEHAQGDPVFLAFTPDGVLATTFSTIVLKELTYQEVSRAGLAARFEDTSERINFSLGIGEMVMQMGFSKILKPNYPELLFSEREEWITDRTIHIGLVPQSRLN
jgi:hypothetical protein